MSLVDNERRCDQVGVIDPLEKQRVQKIGGNLLRKIWNKPLSLIQARGVVHSHPRKGMAPEHCFSAAQSWQLFTMSFSISLTFARPNFSAGVNHQHKFRSAVNNTHLGYVNLLHLEMIGNNGTFVRVNNTTGPAAHMLLALKGISVTT